MLRVVKLANAPMIKNLNNAQERHWGCSYRLIHRKTISHGSNNTEISGSIVFLLPIRIECVKDHGFLVYPTGNQNLKTINMKASIKTAINLDKVGGMNEQEFVAMSKTLWNG